MNLTRLILHKFDPEVVHELAIKSCSTVSTFPLLNKAVQKIYQYENIALNRTIGNLTFPNPIGLAAGFDKDGVAVETLQSLGFGFIEVGTITPISQPGNDKPRLFRLKEDEAVINRMGFNNKGVDQLIHSLSKVSKTVPVGINLGKNKNTSLDNAANDYITCLEKTWEYADYFSVNISSPNTENLRDLQQEEYLAPLIESILNARNDKITSPEDYKQVWLKIAPDLDDKELQVISDLVVNLKVDALVVTNTTITRPGIKSSDKSQTGGLSGKPLLELSNQILSKVRQLTKGKVPLIGVGGIFTGDDVLTKMNLGADLVQLYTGFIFNGPGFIKKLKKDLVIKSRNQN